jgi:hydrogenase maturation protease
MIIKILGIGQSLRGNDEVGLEIVRRWRASHGADNPDHTIEAEIVESPGLSLLGLIAGLDAAILVDAVQSGAPPGTLHKLTEEDLLNFGEGTGSAHGWGAAETLSLGRQLSPDDLPERIFIIGVEAVQFNLGEGLSPAVEASIPRAIEMINGILGEFIESSRKGLFDKIFRLLRIR